MNEVITTNGPSFKDRKTGLVVFGIFEILLGALFALMVLVMTFGMVASAVLHKGSTQSMNAGMMIPGLLFYVLLATWFIWMGIGSIMARRWARALLLVTSWFWLINGILGLAFMLTLMPDMYGPLNSAQIPHTVATIIKWATIGIMVVFYIIIPGAIILFYGSRHVKATCEQRDPQVRWTDRCPLPVLAVSLMAGCSTACMPFAGLYGWVIPFFGVILNGIAGAAVLIPGTLLLGYVSWGMYRLRINAWRCAAGVVVFWGISSTLTFTRVGLMELYEKMNFPAQQLDAMRQMPLPQGHWIVLFTMVWVAIALGYLLRIKRYFTTPPADPKGTP